MIRCLVLAALMAAAVASGLRAQSTAARVLGTVADPTGAVIPAATVTAANTATGWKITATSNASGQYLLFPLAPGIYTIDFQKEDLKGARIEQIQLHASDEVVRNVTLEVGGLAQTVTVEAAGAPAVNEAPSVENIVTEDQVNTLPLNGRDYNQLVFLSAGAVDYSVTGTNYDLGTVAVNGNRGYSNGYLVDGVSNDSSFQNNAAAPLSVALIREFKVISGVAPAEYGQAGTSITVVTKSGTNQFHGNVFEYYRGNTLATRNPFTTTTVLPPYYSHQFGGALGGPLRLPKYNGHNRTFFFVNYEGLQQDGGGTRVSTVAPAAFWQGDFSSLLPRIQLKDPLTPGNPPFPGNRIPVSRMDPVALKLRPLFPDPSLPGLANNLVQSVDTIAMSNQFTAKVDHLLPHNNSLSARLTYFNGGGFSPGIIGTPHMGYVQPRHGENGMLSWTALVNTRTVNEFRLGAATLTRYDIYFNDGYPNSDTLGMQGTVPISSNLVPPLPIIQFTGADAFTQLSYWPAVGLGANLSTLANNVYSLSDVVTTTRGRHQLKAGFDGRRTNLNWLYENNGNGVIAFNGANASRSTGYSFGDFLLGVPSSTQQTPLQDKVLYIESDYALFVQDDWRARSNLTLTLGVRNEMNYHPEEQYNRFAIFSPDLGNGGGGIVVACSNGQLPTNEFNPGVVSKLTNSQGKFSFPLACGSSVGYDPRTLVENHPWNPGPRAGLAWDPTGHGKWLVRSGYGIFYTRLPEQYLSLGVGQNPPFASVLSYSQTVTNGVPSLTLTSPYPVTGSASVTPYGLERNFRLPSNQQWNLALERSLGSNTVVTLTYVGNKGTHLFRSINLNQTLVDPTTGKIVRKYQSTFGGAAVNYEMADGDSTYNSMELEVRRRFSHGLAYQSNWTWAKGLDDVGLAANASLLDAENLGRDRANSDYVRRHQITSNFTWEIPVGRGRRFGAALPLWLNGAVGGWRLSGIQRYTTGRYLTATYTNTGAFGANNRPDSVYGVSPNLPAGQRTPQHWFNPSAFAVPPAVDPVTSLPRFGNAGRNTIIGPGFNNVDGSLSKVFPVRTEKRQLVVRMDVFNVMNHPNWANPDLNISDVNTVATINVVNRNMRQAQFAVEFRF